MKVKSSGRSGFAPHQPECASVAALLPAQRDQPKMMNKNKESSEQSPSKRQRTCVGPSKDIDAVVLDEVKAGLKEYQSRMKLPKTASLCDFDLDELRGFSATTAQALGLSKSASARLAAKVKGLLLQHSDAEQKWPEQYTQRRREARALVLRMLHRDDELRLSSESQRRYALAGDGCMAKESVTHSIQRQVVREAGFSGREGMKVGLDMLQSALALFPGDAEIKNAAFYLRNNIHFQCPIAVGGTVPDVALVECVPNTNDGTKDAVRAPFSTTPCSLRRALAGADYTVLIAGSGTWPPLRHDAPVLNRIRRRHTRLCAAAGAQLRVQWLFVGIMEAHASDVWPLAFSFEQKDCTDVGERSSRALSLCAELFPSHPVVRGAVASDDSIGWRVLVDTMDDSFHKTLGAWPTNYYVMRRDGVLMFVSDDDSDDNNDGSAAPCATRLRGFLASLIKSKKWNSPS